MIAGSDEARTLTNAERYRLMELRDAGRLADLVALTGVDSEHAAYFAAKREWDELRSKELAGQRRSPADLPGNAVVVDDTVFRVHGITHAGTDAERSYLRNHVDAFVRAGEAVYCEQGIRSMYFDDMDPVCEMDDYRWAMAECEKLDAESHAAVLKPNFDSISEDIDSLTDRFRDTVFSMIESGGSVDESTFRRAIGDVASSFLTSKEEMATGEDFESFRKRRTAATNPRRLVGLQHYYERRFLPQPIEREWLRRHDPELELVTHARNERIADYARYHSDADGVHLIVGAAHQPGVTYYLEQHRDGARDLVGFDPIP